MKKLDKIHLYERVYYWLPLHGIAPTIDRVTRVIEFLEQNHALLSDIEAKASCNFAGTRVWPWRIGNDQKYVAVINGEKIYRPENYFRALEVDCKIVNTHYFIRLKGTKIDGRSKR